MVITIQQLYMKTSKNIFVELSIDLLWKNYGIMEKGMVLWKKLWNYNENYGTLIYNEKNYGTVEKTMVL